jgi:tRNA dimethylallyltransferase
VGLDPERERLYERIERRTELMFSQGLIEETRRLLEAGVPRSAQPFGALGYREAVACLDGNMTLAEAIETTARMTRRYAKRQMTWFRRESGIQWFAGFGDEPHIQSEALGWLRERLEGELGASDRTEPSA